MGDILKQSLAFEVNTDEGDMDISSSKMCGLKGSVSVLTWCRELASSLVMYWKFLHVSTFSATVGSPAVDHTPQ
jgi:hypothetical protein